MIPDIGNGGNCVTETPDKFDGRWWQQGENTRCFVIAAANWSLAQGRGVGRKKIKKAVAVGGCEHGATVNQKAVLDFFGLETVGTMSYTDVVSLGGIIRIMHPIFNVHAVYLHPDGKTDDGRPRALAINSWIAPPVFPVTVDDLMPVAVPLHLRAFYVEKQHEDLCGNWKSENPEKHTQLDVENRIETGFHGVDVAQRSGGGSGFRV